mmetsp:Transcript_127368/g.224280  ORF Transcript_127368/g.224280 Transcript_127368/m.224280 type:complete len:206 (+) Transcript_127368:2-619(+)
MARWRWCRGLLLWAFLACESPARAASSKAGARVGSMLTQPAQQEASLCMRRVASLPKEEGYTVLCNSVQALYQQQRSTAARAVAVQDENAQLKHKNALLQEQERYGDMERSNVARKLSAEEEALKHEGAVHKRTLLFAQRSSREHGVAVEALAEVKRENAALRARIQQLEASLQTQQAPLEDVQGLLQQIRALQNENAQLVRQCA